MLPYCPVNGWDCPYYVSGKGQCSLKNVETECDDYVSIMGFFEEDEEEEE